MDWLILCRLKRIIAEHIGMDQREVIIVDSIGSDKSKKVGLEQEDQIKRSREDESKNSRKENFLLWKCL